jgi:hypothetical protein
VQSLALAQEPKSSAPAAGTAEPVFPVPKAGPAHHHGLKEEFSPHNGWARYGRLTLDLGGDRYFVYDQGQGEFSGTVVERGSNDIRLRGISIPGAGLFYFPSESSPCQPDALERLGLYAELALFYLSSAFPGGPSSVTSAATIVVDLPIPELRFMDGLMKPREGIRTLVQVTPSGVGKVQYVFVDDKDNVRGEWEAETSRAVTPDDEPLHGWQTCWSGTWSKGPAGGRFFSPKVANTTSLKSFGDVRKALRNK